jgi:radical SAM superfamily enzyme YgiQ (UPF0313 family)
MRLSLIWPRTRDFPVYERLVPTLTLPYIAALTPPSWSVTIADDNYDEVDLARPVDLVGISVSTMGAVRAYELADAFRARGVPVVLGGWHATLLPDEAAAHADAVVVGEADDTWATLLDDFARGRLATRYVSRNNTDLAGFPKIDRSLLEGRRYLVRNLVQATRGCPYRCSFCSVSTVNPKYRRRPVDDVAAEVAAMRGRALFFIDDNVFIHREYTRDLFRALAPLGKKWIGEVSIDIAEDAELLDLAAASGLIGVLVGFESVLPGSIQEMNKHRTNHVERYRAQIRALHERGVGVLGMFTFGFDHDTVDVFERTLEFCEETDIFGASFGILTPFPGTPAYHKLEAEGRLTNRDWRLYDLQHLVFDLPGWTPESLQAAVQRVEQRFYSPGAFARRTWKLRKYPRLLRSWNLLLYLAVNLQYFATLRHRRGAGRALAAC